MFGSVWVNMHASMTGAGIDSITVVGKDKMQDGITTKQQY